MMPVGYMFLLVVRIITIPLFCTTTIVIGLYSYSIKMQTVIYNLILYTTCT